MESRLINNDGQGAFWCFLVKYAEDTPASPEKPKVDYKSLLGEAAYKRFSKMRDIRRQLAAEEGVPAYAIFTDEELAGMAKVESLTMVELAKIRGIGEKKIEKYGSKFIFSTEI